MFAKSFDGTKIHYKMHEGKRGSKQCLVFLHGWAVNWTCWKKEIAFFNRRGYSTVAIDFRGHGSSGKPSDKRKYRLRYFVEDVDAVLRKENVSNAVVVGHSLGGVIAVMYQNEYPGRVRALVLANTTYRADVMPFVRFFPLLERLSDYLIDHGLVATNRLPYMRDFDVSKYSKDVFSFIVALINTPLLGVYAVLKPLLSVDVEDMLSSVEVPVLIIASERDQFFRRNVAEVMHRKISRSRLVFFPGTHGLIIHNPAQVSRAVLDFVGRV